MLKSKALFEKAQQVIPGGVNSSVRAYRSVGGTPPFIKRASGSRIYDVDGRGYIDYVGSFGPAIVGHAHPEVVAVVQDAVGRGLSFGAPTEAETELCRKVVEAVPAMDMFRLVSSGTEACMSAIRLARGFTKRDKIVKFSGCYHGHGDMLLAKAGSGLATFAIPDSAGVPKDVVSNTLVVPFNDLEALETVFKKYSDEIAAVITEPIAGNAGCIFPKDGFLKGIQDLCQKHGALFVLDEVMTGFRVAWGGCQVLWNLSPDLSTFGKVVGGGMPLAGFGGRREIMEYLSPVGPVYQAGTLSGNPVSVAAGLRTLELMERPGSYAELGLLTTKLVKGIKAAAEMAKIPLQTTEAVGMFGVFFSSDKIERIEDIKPEAVELFKRYFHLMLERGIYLAPSAYEAGFVSLAHSFEDIEMTISSVKASMHELSSL